MRRHLIPSIILIIFLLPHSLWAQNYLLNTNPPSLKWSKIKTQNFSIYFDKNINPEGEYIANLLEHLYKPVSFSLNVNPGRIPVILQNQTVFSNGFVSETPLRAEFYLFRPQYYMLDGLMRWDNMLSVHELRHVVQYNKSLTGFNKLAYILFGYEAASTLSHLAVPDWFWEGDAVLTETALTQSGRGREPNFSALMKINMMERGPFNYYLQYLRSFRYKIPDHYVTGYYLTSYLRRKYGAETVSTILKKTWSWPFVPFRFSHQLKKATGENLLNNYRAMTLEMDSVWHQQVNEIKPVPVEHLKTGRGRFYTDYRYPQYLPNGNIFVLKSGIDDYPTFTELDLTGNEKRLFTPGLADITGYPTVGAGKIAWTEVEYDPRWPARSYSVIKIFDTENKKLTRISRKSRYASSGISPDGKKIVTLETTTDLQYNLMILSSEDGTILEKIENPGNHFFLTPSFSKDGMKIIAIMKSDKGKAIWIYDLTTKTAGIIYGPVDENIADPCLSGDFIFYNSPVNGIDNIYALNVQSKKIYQVTNTKYGAYDAHVSTDFKKIIFNDFGKDGMEVSLADIDTTAWTSFKDIKNVPIDYFQPVAGQETTNHVFANTGNTEYRIAKVNKFRGIFNPYGWGPYVAGTDLNLFIGIRCQDILSTTILNGGYEYNSNESTGRWLASVSYQGLYPVINFSGYSGKRSVNETFTLNQNTNPEDTTVNVQWSEKGFNFGLDLPFDLTHSKYLETLSVSAYTSYTNVTGYNFFLRHPDQQSDGNLIYNTYTIRYNRALIRSHRDINSKFAQLFFVQFKHTPFGGDYSAKMFAAEGRFIFPGLFKHHSLNLRISYLAQDLSENKNSYWLSNPLFYPRGYSYYPFEKFTVASGNYLFPVWYPDLHIGPVINIQRIYTNIFLDHGTGESAGSRDQLTSTGIELYFDFNAMRYLSLFNLGVRYSYVPQNNAGMFQFLIGSFGI